MARKAIKRVDTILVTGHRGASLLKPENTIAGFRIADELGCNSIEFDVNLTRDGVPVVIHDDTVDRTTTGTGRVSDLDMDELRRLNAGDGERVPSLDEVLRFAGGTKMDVQIELKGEGTIRPSIERVIAQGMISRARFTSFDTKRMTEVKNEYPEATTGILLNAVPDDPLTFFLRTGADYCHLDTRVITPEIVRFFHRNGIPVVAFGTVLDEATVDRLVDCGVVQIGSDRPDIVIRRLSELGRYSPSH